MAVILDGRQKYDLNVKKVIYSHIKALISIKIYRCWYFHKFNVYAEH